LPEPDVTSFRHVGDRLVHRGFIWNVVVGTFKDPTGQSFQRDIVRSPGAVAAVPVLFDDAGNPEVIFVRQYRPPLDRLVLEIPAGIRDVPDEATDVTAARELVEEVGLAAGKLEYLTHYYTSAGMTDSVLHVYLATDLTPVPRSTHGPEEDHMEIVRFSLSDAVDLVAQGEIHDAKTIIGLMLVDRRWREGRL
jgi:8-oxo-dGTP pyrophosphatase MutT (NUDIX family)